MILSSPLHKQKYYRLIALWVLSEAMLGGVIHAAKIPVSGLMVGSAAVICICLIAYYAPGKGNIIKATIIVSIFKMILSPQAPMPAYFAVFFQGIMGELLFWDRKFFRLSCLLLGLIALLESGLQRIIVLTIVYGNNFWTAINDSINKLFGNNTFTNYSLYVAIGYVLVHMLTGLIVGWWAGIIPASIQIWSDQYRDILKTTAGSGGAISSEKNKKGWIKVSLLIVWLLLLLLFLQSYLKIGDPILPARLPVQILIRSIIIIFTWYFLVGPFLSLLLKKWLEKKQSASRQEVKEIALLLPMIKAAMNDCWKASSSTTGLKKIILWGKLTLVSVLSAYE